MVDSERSTIYHFLRLAESENNKGKIYEKHKMTPN